MNRIEQEACDKALRLETLKSGKFRFTPGFEEGLLFAAKHGYVPPVPQRCGDPQPGCGKIAWTCCELEVGHTGDHKRSLWAASSFWGSATYVGWPQT